MTKLIDFYLNHVREMRQAACLTMDSGEQADHLLHMSLYAEELEEFLEACAYMDKRAIADALGDIVVVACGYALDAGQNTKFDVVRAVDHANRAADVNGIMLSGAFLLIHESNMSKLCTEAQATATRLKYADMGIEVEFRDAGNGMWSAFAANDAGKIPRGKWLKGVGFHEPAWDRVEVWKH